MRMTDGHTHIIEEAVSSLYLAEEIFALTTGTTPEDCRRVAAMAAINAHIIPCFGLHPWYADQYTVKEMREFLDFCPVIGEIGMDSVWCEVDLRQQRRAFLQQLAIAEDRHCPVVLHTKGQEREIAHQIKDTRIPILVHWYSASDHLELFLQKDCYFTIGPDIASNKEVQTVAKEVPLSRLMVETDGLAALEWALGRKVNSQEIPNVLAESVAAIAAIKQMDPQVVQAKINQNFLRFVYPTRCDHEEWMMTATETT